MNLFGAGIEVITSEVLGNLEIRIDNWIKIHEDRLSGNVCKETVGNSLLASEIMVLDYKRGFIPKILLEF